MADGKYSQQEKKKYDKKLEIKKLDKFTTQNTASDQPKMNIQVHNIQNNYSINYTNGDSNEIELEKGEKKVCCKLSDCTIF